MRQTRDGRAPRAARISATGRPAAGISRVQCVPEDLRRAARGLEVGGAHAFPLAPGRAGKHSVSQPRGARRRRNGRFLQIGNGAGASRSSGSGNAGAQDECEWCHATVLARFDGTMAPSGRDFLPAAISCMRKARSDTPRSGARKRNFRHVLHRAAARVCRRGRDRLPAKSHARGHRRKARHDDEEFDRAPRVLAAAEGVPLRFDCQCLGRGTPIPGLCIGASMCPGRMVLGGPGYLAAKVVAARLASLGSPRRRYLGPRLFGEQAARGCWGTCLLSRPACECRPTFSASRWLRGSGGRNAAQGSQSRGSAGVARSLGFLIRDGRRAGLR